MPDISRPGARERILEVASALFYRRGINNVGVDEIIARSGVAKMSLYNHFGSKEGLVLAFLHREEENWRGWLHDEVEQRAGTSREQLLAIFDLLEEWFESPYFRGSALLNAAVEIADANHPIHQASHDHWLALGAYVKDLADRAPVPDPESLAQQVMILLQGAIVTALVEGNPAPAKHARRALESLLYIA